MKGVLVLALVSFAVQTGCSKSEAEQSEPHHDDADASPQLNSTNLEQTPDPQQQQTTSPPFKLDPDRIARGRLLFAVAPGMCIKCHGPDATGSDRAPDLTTGVYTHSDGSPAQIQKVIIAGVPKNEHTSPDYPFAMNPRGGTNLSDEQCLDLAHYVRSLAGDG